MRSVGDLLFSLRFDSPPSRRRRHSRSRLLLRQGQLVSIQLSPGQRTARLRLPGPSAAFGEISAHQKHQIDGRFRPCRRRRKWRHGKIGVVENRQRFAESFTESENRHYHLFDRKHRLFRQSDAIGRSLLGKSGFFRPNSLVRFRHDLPDEHGADAAS